MNIKVSSNYSKVSKLLALFLVAALPFSLFAAPGDTPVAVTAISADEIEDTDEDVVTMSKFEVISDKDDRYLKTNAVTATRIGMEIQNVPMSVSVMGEDFLQDAGLNTVTDLLRYQASGNPDGRYLMERPANSATPRGNFTMRGFKVNSILRDGVFRYTQPSLDSIDRVEIVKGPAAVFFGQGYPGGVINYISKKPSFTEIPTTIRHSFNSYDGQKIKYDHNAILSDQAALRVSGEWKADNGERVGEYERGYSITPSFTYVPFDNNSVTFNFNMERYDVKRNHNEWQWIYPPEWFSTYDNPTLPYLQARGLLPSTATDADVTVALQDQYRSAIFRSLGGWRNDHRVVLGDPNWVLYNPTSGVMPRGAWYLDQQGQEVYQDDFNFASEGTFNHNEITTITYDLTVNPTDYLTLRYIYTQDRNDFSAIEGRMYSNADRNTFNTLQAGNTTQYDRQTQNHQVDVILDLDVFGITGNVMVGGVKTDFYQRYGGNVTNNVPLYFLVPGYNDPTYTANNPNKVVLPGLGGGGWTTSPTQVLRDRNGVIYTPERLYTEFDPGHDAGGGLFGYKGAAIRSPLDKVFLIERNVFDGYKTTQDAWYVNTQFSFLEDDALTLLAGYRKEQNEDLGQWAESNAPWFAAPPDAFKNQSAFPSDVWMYSPGYQATNFESDEGDSYNVGVSYAINDEISVYVTHSKTFKFNTGNYGGVLGDEVLLGDLVQAALDFGYQGPGNPLAPGSYVYGSTTISSVQQGLDDMRTRGVLDPLGNEEGLNYEIGVKTSLNDNQIVSTMSIFRGERSDEKLDDSTRQQADPYNTNYTGIPLFAAGSGFDNRRNFRWRTTGRLNRIEGFEFETIWSPTPNFQALINGSWLWEAATLEDPTRTMGTIGGDYLFNNRIENVPEFRFNFFANYTFTEGFLEGFTAGLGMRYATKSNMGRNNSWMSADGSTGFFTGDYTVFDANVSYPWEVLGLNITTQFQVSNLTDTKYHEGSYVLSPARNWTLSNTLSF
jgi:outer membrane receptor protein involved in Fe transport